MLAALVIGVVLTVGAGLITLLAVRDIRASRRQVRAMQLALTVAEQRAADEEARRESALRLLDEQRTQRLIEYAEYTARLQALEVQYGDELQKYRLAVGTRLIPFKGRPH